MEKREMLYEGKAKKVYATDQDDVVIVSYKDDATAFNGLKKGTIEGKGVINNIMSNYMFQALEKKGIPTHYIQQINDRETYVKKVDIIKVEVVVRNIACGSLCKRLGFTEGEILTPPIVEFSYKNDELGDPLINDMHVQALKLATVEEMETIRNMALEINRLMIAFFDSLGITLVDFKLEFGRTADGKIVLADEISPDTCRFWDKQTGEKMDKDRFRQDLGGEVEAYQKVFARLMEADQK